MILRLKIPVVMLMLREVMVGVRLCRCKSVGGAEPWMFAMMQEFGYGLGGVRWFLVKADALCGIPNGASEWNGERMELQR
jgi:hypothetical protein